jgi:hypothetical protein
MGHPDFRRARGVAADSPEGNDRKKSKSKNNCNSRFPEGMTERKARARTTATADSLRE